MSRIQGFPPIARRDARILVLGSVPSEESIRLQQYYAHPRNAFWPLMKTLLNGQAEHWPDKVSLLLSHRVALWDVLKSCDRSGSLDSAIITDSMAANDFPAFFDEHPNIGHVFFNGAKAEEVFRRHVRPGLPVGARNMPITRLPSTSPAHASMNLEQKTRAWRVILDALE